LGIQISKIGEFKGHQQSIYSITNMGHGDFLSVGGGGMLVKWNKLEKDGHLISRIPEPIYSIAYHQERGVAAIGTRGGTIYEIEIANTRLLRQWTAHQEAIFDLHYENDYLFSAGHDGHLKKWGGEIAEPLLDILLSNKSLRCLHENKGSLWIGGSEGKIWRLNDGDDTVCEIQKVSDNSVFAIDRIADQLVTTGRDAHLHVWKRMEKLNEISAHWYTVHALSLSPDGRYLASGSMDKSIKIWDAKTFELLKVIDRERYGAHTSSVNKIVWLSDTEFLSCSDDRCIYLWEVSEI